MCYYAYQSEASAGSAELFVVVDCSKLSMYIYVFDLTNKVAQRFVPAASSMAALSY